MIAPIPIGNLFQLCNERRGGQGRSRGATGGEPLPPLASAASRRVGPCTRSVVQRSCTGGPGAASASVTLGRRADSERSGPPALSARKLPAQEVPRGETVGPDYIVCLVTS